MATRNLYSALSYSLTLLLLGSCTVYVPMQPTVSTVSCQGQLELAGSMQANSRLEGTAVYSPLPHTLVMAAGSFRPKIGDTTFSATRQWEAGLGSYAHLGSGWLLTGMAGYGRATTSKAIPGVAIGIYGGGTSVYDARYRKLFGQLSLAHEARRQSFGVVYRLARVSYDQLDYRFGLDNTAAVVAIPMKSAFRHEGLSFYRVGLDPRNRWQLQATLGLSVAQQPERVVTPVGPNRNDGYTEQNEAKKASRPVLMTSLGVVFRPQFLSRKAAGSQP
ncbi:hypothetical protein LGH70_20070 [Hymenobacter sp. BT635]|uniref:Outer membrane protein beta-barrel domain-containing protein n=1 Tax=Hymenobacter nitidus TaxID=2880929 RepID=A0ABS8AIJ3_9BACT|nr:hypothetical protein [Hymenobacter nitidus]MCB2379904.1 hypothetical protein [Hymenobacter nitidus]